MQPHVVQLRRLVIGDAARFPQLGRRFYELGLGRTTEELSAVFGRLAENGHLELDDPRLAAEHFIGLVLSRATLSG